MPLASLALAEVLHEHWPRFARTHAPRLAAAHYRAARAVLCCRTPVLGGQLWQCACHAHARHYSYHSCNHRSCPQCGAIEQQQWCATQETRLLPGVPYFLVTLTVPDALRGVCMAHPAILYDLLLREAAGALKDLCRSKLGGTPGFTTVLHTWGRQLQHHPHVHIVIPGVVLAPDGSERYPTQPGFLLHGTPLAIRLRNRLELALKTSHPEIHEALRRDHPDVFRVKWIADVRHTGSGKPALRYLARYVFKSALGPGRLLGYDGQGRLRLQCHESGTNRPFVITLTPEEFLRRWCVHVLPKGFVRVRHHGWMSGAARKVRLLVRALVCGELDEPAPAVILPPVPRCERCGAEMKLVTKVEPRGPPPRT